MRLSRRVDVLRLEIVDLVLAEVAGLNARGCP
jgi:hypothetical protein